jgi:hypothetical protein
MKANLPLVTDQDTINYIACVANAVVNELDPEFRDLNWEMAIFAGDTVNAFAMPGGKIGIMEVGEVVLFEELRELRRELEGLLLGLAQVPPRPECHRE